ncbi:lysophospholipid acyltransferase family protein [Candidatus Omnitrophota bacterium]
MKIKTRRYYIYQLAAIGGFFVAILPLGLGLFLAGLAGKLAFSFGGRARETALQNLRLSFPEKSEAELRRITRDVFSNLAKNLVEWINIYKLSKDNLDRWVTQVGFDKVERAFSETGKGVIVLSAHFGNWELASFCFSFSGHRSTAVARRIYFRGYDKFINNMRNSKGVNIIYRDDSPKKILKLLRRNEAFGLLADQDVDSVEGVFVNFFGRPAYTPKAPVALSLVSGAPIFPCFVIRENGRHKLILEGPMELEKRPTKEETIKVNTQKWVSIQESYIRKYPEQWVWMHKRWKTKPPEGTKV